MRCPNCQGKLVEVLTVGMDKPLTLPSKQILYAEPKPQQLDFETELEPKPKKKCKRRPSVRYVKKVAEHVKPLKLVTVQNAKITLYWCPTCQIFLKAIS